MTYLKGRKKIKDLSDRVRNQGQEYSKVGNLTGKSVVEETETRRRRENNLANINITQSDLFGPIRGVEF